MIHDDRLMGFLQGFFPGLVAGAFVGFVFVWWIVRQG